MPTRVVGAFRNISVVWAVRSSSISSSWNVMLIPTVKMVLVLDVCFQLKGGDPTE